MGMFSIYSNGELHPGNWIGEKDKIMSETKNKIKNSKVYQEEIKKVPPEDILEYNVRTFAIEHWQFIIIGFAALIVLIKD